MGLNMKSLSDATSGAIASLVSTSILYPLDTCKTKFQAEVRAHHQLKYRKTSDVLWEAISTNQILSLYQGIGTKNVQSFISSFIYFYGYSFFRQLYLQKSGNKTMGTKANLIVATMAGVGTVVLTQPLDTASSRMQTSEFGKSKGLRETLSEGTWGEAFDGLAISLLLTSNPTIQYTAFDQLKNRLLKRKLSKKNKYRICVISRSSLGLVCFRIGCSLQVHCYMLDVPGYQVQGHDTVRRNRLRIRK